MITSERAFLALAGLSRPRRIASPARPKWETKSAANGDGLSMIDKMLYELRQQFAAFKTLRLEARRKLANAGEDEAAQRLAKADLRLVVDGLNLIVRTLEKLDNLRRGMAADEQRAEDERLKEAGLEDGRARLAALIAERIEEEVARRLAARAMAAAEEGGRHAGA